MATRDLFVGEDETGLRLDAFLVRKGVVTSGARARRMIAEGRVRVGGRPVRKGGRLTAGAVITIADDEPSGTPAVVPDPNMRLVVLFEDAHLVAVDKPAGVPSFPLAPGERGTVAGALVARYPGCVLASEDPREGGLVHRLDVGTSGVLVAARDREAWTRLRAAFAGQHCEKIYLAEVVGRPRLHGQAGVSEPTPDHYLIEAAIGRPGRRAGHVKIEAGRGPMPARTEVTLGPSRGETTIVEARLARGRPHQVRVHLAHLGCPILGDTTYGDDHARTLAAARGVTGFRLHALSVTLNHPFTGERLTIAAPMPAWASNA